MPLITCKDITLDYDGLITVSGLQFQVEEQDYLCIIGDNGTGKSTLMKALLGLKHPTHGSIVLENGIYRRDFGYLAQQTDVQKEFPASVWEVILSGCLNRKGFHPFYSAYDKERGREAMETLGILNLKDHCYRELSGGQQQRVLLARAMCATNRILLLDEPTTGLDPTMTTELFEWVGRMNRQDGVAIIMVTHDTHCAVKYSKHILHLHDGIGFYSTTPNYIQSEIGKKYIGGHPHD